MTEISDADLNMLMTAECESFGYRVIRCQLSVEGCSWQLARRLSDGEMCELEIYEKHCFDTAALAQYQSMFSDPKATLSSGRFPTAIHETERHLLLVRQACEGEPFARTLMRPGRMPLGQAAKTIPALCAVLREAERHGWTPADVLPNLFVGSDGQVFLDAPASGPRVRADATTEVLRPLLRESATVSAWPSVACRCAVRLVTGDDTLTEAGIETMLADDRIAAAEAVMLRDVLNTASTTHWPDRHFRKAAPKRRHGGMWLALAVLVLGGVAFAYFGREAGGWAGGQYEGGGAVDPEPVPIDVERPPADTTTPSIRPRLQDDGGAAVRLAKGGRFGAADVTLAPWAKARDLNEDEAVFLANTRSELQSIMETSFREQMADTRFLYERGEFDAAGAKLRFLAGIYPDQTYRKQLNTFYQTVERTRRNQLRDELVMAEQLRARQEFERELVAGLMARRRYWTRTHGKRLNAASEKAQSRDAKYVLTCLTEFHQAELQLYKSLTRAVKTADDAVLTRVKAALPDELAGTLSEITRAGLVVIQPRTVVELKWQEMEPDRLHAMLAAILKRDGGTRQADRFRLYLFCRRYGLVNEAAAERRGLTDPFLLQRLERFAGFKDKWEVVSGRPWQPE